MTLQTQWNDIRGETSLPIGKTLENERVHLFTFKDWCLGSQIALQVVIRGTGPNIDTSIHSIVFASDVISEVMRENWMKLVHMDGLRLCCLVGSEETFRTVCEQLQLFSCGQFT